MYEVRAGSNVVTNLLFHFISFYHILLLVFRLSLIFSVAHIALLKCVLVIGSEVGGMWLALSRIK